MALTGKQERFAQEVAKGKSLSDAYRTAYDAKRMSNPAVNTEASKLAANPAITLRVEELRSRVERAHIASCLSDRERVLRRLRELLDNAEGTASESIQLRAADLLGKSVGLYREVSEVTDRRSDMTPDEIRAEIARRMSLLTEGDPDRETKH